MLLVHPSLTNITILSIFKIILFEIDYRTVNVFTRSTRDDNAALEIVLDTLMTHAKPTNILNFNTNLTNRKRCEGPILNVIFMMDTTVALLDGIKHSIYPNDISLMLDSTAVHRYNTQIETNIDDWMQVSNKVLVINNLAMLAIHPMRLYHKMDIMPLHPFDQGNAKDFIQSYIHSSNYLKQEKNLTIFFQFLSPRSMIAFVEDRMKYIGSDGSITSILLQILNATGTFVSDVGLVYPRLVQNWANNKDQNRVQQNAYEYYQNAMTRNNLTVYNQSVTATDIDLHMSPFIVQQDFEDQRLNLSTERMYPHERECVVVIVRKQTKPDHFLTKVMRNGDLQSVGLATLTLIITRILIEKAPYEKWFSIAYKTFGILFNQVVIRNNNFLESAWTNIVKGFSAIATVALSAIIYNNLVNDKYSEIDTIEDLIASNLTAIAPNTLKTQLTLRLSESRPKLLKNIVFKGIETLGSSILALNFSFAYILKENPAKNYLQLVKYAGKTGDSGRIMNENLYCDMLSYRINYKSNYKRFVDDFTLRILENGLYRKHLEWATALLKGLFRTPELTTSGIKFAFTMNMISGVFNIYLTGIGISCVVFLVENIYVKCWRRLF